MSGPWSSCIFLLIFIVAARAQDCIVKYKDVVITDFDAGLDGENIPDTTLGDVPVDNNFSLENVLGVTIGAETNEYLRVESITPDVLTILTDASFLQYEENEDIPYMLHILSFQCQNGGTKDLVYRNIIPTTNNKNPIFENQNDGSNGYKYSLPMPFPSGISVPQAYNEILAYDNDIGTNDIQFTLSGAGSEYFDVSWTAVVGTDLKIRYSADIIAKNHLYLDVPLSLTITAKGMGGGDPGTELITTASISIDIDTDNSEDPVIVPTAFKEQIYYSQEAVDESTPVGTIATTVPMEIENAKDEVDYDITVTTPVGGATIPVDLFSADYDTTTKLVTLSLSRALSAEEGLNEIFTLRLEAKDPSDIEFLAETIVYVDVRAIDGSFESDLYVSNIDDPDMETTVPLVTDPVEIKIISVPSDNIIVTLEKPYSNAVWVENQFVAEYVTGGVVVIKLNQKLTEDALKLPSINLLLKATETGTDFEARTLVQVNMPTVVSQISFSNNLYTAEILSPGMQSGVLETSPEIILSNCVSTDTVDLVQQDGLPFWDDQFSVTIDPATCIVTLSLAKPLTPEALAEEILVLQLLAKDVSGADLAKTLIQVDIPLTILTEATTAFSSPLYTSSINTETENVIDHVILTNDVIDFKETPTGTVTVELTTAPGNALSFPENYAATYDTGTASVTIKLIQVLSGDALSAEVHVMTLAASVDGILQSETLIYIDIIPASIPPPVVEGEFSSALYTSEITDPSTPQVLDTIGAINIAQPPSDVVVTLEAAPESIPSYVENFAITQPDADGNIVLSLETPLPPDASENSYLVLILHAESASIVDYFEESVIHVKLPDVVCSITTTTCPSWASCPPCTCTTPLPSGSITFDQATYITTTAHDTIGTLFTVKATHSSGSGSFTYAINYGDIVPLEESIQIDPTSGVVSKNAPLAPGRYDFQVTALHSTGEQASNPAIIYVESTGTCEDGSTCFEYAVINKPVNEAEDVEILPANTVQNACTYRKVVMPDLASSWFLLEENTGQLNITKDSDLEALLQIQNNPQVYVEMTVDCEDPTAAPMSIHLLPREIPPEISITRQEMVVVITLEDKNDQNPIFEISELAVAYPILDLARQLLPGPIAAVTATDEDSSDKALSYSLATINEKYSVHPETGKLYPVDGIYNYVDETVYVAAFDSANNRAEIKYHLRHVTHNEIAAVTILGAWLEDEETILEYIATNSPDYTWGSLKSAVLAEPPSKQITPELQSRLLRSAERAGNTGGMFLVLYAINEKLKPVPYDELVKLLEELPPSENWQVSAVETWEQSTGNPDPISAGYRAATIALGIITGLLLLALVFVIYLFVVRKKQKEKLRAKAGFKNRTSFSNQGVLENGKAPHHDDHSIHEDGLKLPETMSEQEERRKSMVTFSDEPEVIPGQSVRL